MHPNRETVMALQAHCGRCAIYAARLWDRRLYMRQRALLALASHQLGLVERCHLAASIVTKLELE